VGSAPPEKAGAASGIAETGSELGGALGLALLGSLGTAVYRFSLESQMPTGVDSETVEAALDTLGGAAAVASRLPEALGSAVLESAQAAFTAGLRVTAAVSAVVAIAVSIPAVLALRGVEPRDAAATPQSEELTA
jgi:DHA2 family multidrug resistance protein-like MFS transporter